MFFVGRAFALRPVKRGQSPISLGVYRFGEVIVLNWDLTPFHSDPAPAAETLFRLTPLLSTAHFKP